MENLFNIFITAITFIIIFYGFLGCPTTKKDWIKVYNLFFKNN